MGLDRLLGEEDPVLLVTHLRVAQAIFKMLGLDPSAVAFLKLFELNCPGKSAQTLVREV